MNLTTTLDPDTYARFEQFANERNLSRAEAARQLIGGALAPVTPAEHVEIPGQTHIHMPGAPTHEQWIEGVHHRWRGCAFPGCNTALHEIVD